MERGRYPPVPLGKFQKSLNGGIRLKAADVNQPIING